MVKEKWRLKPSEITRADVRLIQLMNGGFSYDIAQEDNFLFASYIVTVLAIKKMKDSK